MTNVRVLVSRNKREGGYVGNLHEPERVRSGFMRREVGNLSNYPCGGIPRMTLRRWAKIQKQWLIGNHINEAL